MIRSRLTCFAVLIALLATTTSCQKQSDVLRGAHDKVLTMSLADDAATLDPALVTSAYTAHILQALFEGLVTISNDGKSILPGIAERWEISPDGKTYTFFLRANARWSNGEPLTARDFLFGFRRIYNPKLGSETAAAGFAIRGAEDSITGRNPDPANVGLAAPDDHTFVITLAHPAAYFLEALVQAPFYPVQESLVTRFHGNEQRGSAWTRPENMVSNGPFKLKTWIGNKVIEVVKNDQYWDAEHVSLNAIRFLPIEDELSEEHAFRAGQVHVTSKSPPDKAASYLSEHPGELRTPAFLRSDYITFNVHRAPFDNPLVRRAFSLAIDRDRLISAVLPHVAGPTYSLTRDGAGGYHPPKSSACRFDPAEAKRLLAQAGYADASKLPPIEFMLNGPQGYILKTGEVLQEMWSKNLGLHVAVLPVEFKIYLESLRTKQFQLLLDDWIYSWDDALDPLQLASTGNPNNDAGYSNAQYDRLFRDAENSADRAQRERDFDAMENIIAEEVPYAPLYARLNDHLVSPLVIGWEDNPVDVINWKEISLRAP
jgi:oligopeptide transport system substrate-binding protein